VEFEFELGEARYCVLRKRSRLGRGQTTLDLHVAYGDGLRPLSGASVRETQQRIVELLGMGYETFINSSLLLQGRADEFTIKPPGERKRILAEILELGRYDELEARARDAMKARDEATRDVERQIAEIDAELSQRSEHEAERARLERARDEWDLALSRAQTVLQTLQDHHARCERARTELGAAEKRLVDAGEQLARLEKQAAEHHQRIAGYEALLADAAAVDAGYARLVALRAEVDTLAEKASAAMALSAQRAKHERDVDRARSALETSLQSLDARLRELATAVARRPELEAALARADTGAARHEALQAEQVAQSQARAAAEAERTTLESTNERLREQFREVVDHRRVLAEAAQCPYCLSPLEGEARQHAI